MTKFRRILQPVCYFLAGMAVARWVGVAGENTWPSWLNTAMSVVVWLLLAAIVVLVVKLFWVLGKLKREAKRDVGLQ